MGLTQFEEELKWRLACLETAARRYANGDDADSQYLLKICDKAKEVLYNAANTA